VIGYYAHHQGDGHVTRAAAIATRCDDALTVLGSRARPDDWRGGDWVQLPRDDDGDGPMADATAGGVLHWAPADHPGLRARMAAIAAWVDAHAPRAMVVDVSVEVALLVRLMGARTVVMALPGTRADDAHRAAYRSADAIVGPWPPGAGVLPGVAEVHEVGAISRFASRAPEPAGAMGGREVLLLSGRGGTALTAADVDAARAATPGWTWTVLGPPGDRWADDPWPLLAAADVVVTHAGQNAIADVATARRPAIVLPQDRPHDEQGATARALDRLGLATVLSSWPEPSAWRALLEGARARGGAGWEAWTLDGAGAARAARVIAEVAACAPR
jgi:hypothetical protein